VITNQGLAIFNVTASSAYPIGYQWLRGGTNLINGGEISGSTSSNLTVYPASLLDIGNYTVILTTFNGSVTSSVATLTILTNPPSITAQPASLMVLTKSQASFTVKASSPYPMSFQWQKNTTNLVNSGEVSGSTSSNLVLFPVTTNDDGNYAVIVTNVYGSVTSSVATLTVGT